MKRILFIAVSALLLVGAGCGAKSKQTAPVPEVVAPPSPVGLPRVLKESFDEDDHLDAALQELDAVE